MSAYELGDYLLIRDDKVLAVSANEEFSDGEHPIAPEQDDTIVAVVSAINTLEYIATLCDGTCGGTCTHNRLCDGTLDPSCGDREAHLAHWG